MSKTNAFLKKSLQANNLVSVANNASKVMSGLLPVQKKQMNKTQMKDTNELMYNQTISGHFYTTPDIAKWAEVYSNPFSTQAARIPKAPLLPTQLIRNYAHGKGVCNSNGNGYVLISPACGATNDLVTVSFSNGPAAPDATSFAGTTDVGGATTSSHYASTNFVLEAQSGNLIFRPVAVGIKIRYIGTVLNAAGTCYTLQITPGAPEDNLQDFIVSDFTAYPNYKEYSFKGSQWHALTRHIRFEEDFHYQGFSNEDGVMKYAMLGGESTSPPSLDWETTMSIYMNAIANAPFEWEFVGHYEIVGPNLDRIGSVNPKSDHVEKVVSSYNKLRNVDNTTKDHSAGQPGGWVDVLKKGVDILLPMVPEFLALL
jgi:hypothetical protein